MRTQWNGVRLVCTSMLLLGLVAGCSSDQLAEEKPLTVSVEESSLTLPGIPGGIASSTTTLVAKVAAIDYKKRTVTLEDENGGSKTLVIGPEAINFDQVEKGDRVSLQYVEETVIFLTEPGEYATDDESATDQAAAFGASAPKGEKPQGIAAATTEIKAIVTAIDKQQHTATLKFEDGSSEEFPVRQDVELSEEQIGKVVVIQITNALAISVEKLDSK